MSDQKKLLLTGIGMLAVGLLGVYVFIGEIRNHYAAPAWPTTKGRVTHAWTERQSWLLGLFSQGSARVEYAYEVGGKRFTGNTISFLADDATHTSDRSAAFGAALAYAAVPNVTVHYDPESPGTSCLVTTGPLRLGPLVLPTVGLLLLVGLGALLVMLAVKPAPSDSASPTRFAQT